MHRECIAPFLTNSVLLIRSPFFLVLFKLLLLEAQLFLSELLDGDFLCGCSAVSGRLLVTDLKLEEPARPVLLPLQETLSTAARLLCEL